MTTHYAGPDQRNHATWAALADAVDTVTNLTWGVLGVLLIACMYMPIEAFVP